MTTASTTTTTVSPQEQALTDAKGAVVAFWRARDEVASNPDLGVNRLDSVARGQALDVHRRSLNAQISAGLKQVGNVAVTPLAASASPDPGQYSVSACVDVSKVNVVDKEGKSQVPPERAERSRYDYVVLKAPEGWFVIQDLLEAQPC
ncbi:MAG: hypothetical protein WAR57_13275 [Candidatus Phosphoribacter sp.]